MANIIIEGLKSVKACKIRANPWVPPVTSSKGFKMRLKFSAANNKAIDKQKYFFI